MFPRSLFIYLTLFVPIVLTQKQEKFTEELLIKPLYSEQVYAHFQFTTKWDTDPAKESFNHTRLFPRALGELIKRHNVKELHVSLTSGLWRYEKWGYPILDAAPGAEVWAWFNPNTVDVDKKWKLLANSLSGLLCASINFIDASNTISPQFTFKPRGVASPQNVDSSFVRYATLPREIVCTENLTPWKKLLPCNLKTGLVSLLNSGYIHNTRYHSIALHVRPICSDKNCESLSYELQQTVSLVYDYKILGTENWSFNKLFGQGVNGHCALADKSEIYVDITSSDDKKFELEPAPEEIVTSFRGGQVNTFARYEVPAYLFGLSAKYSDAETVSLNFPPSLHANQYLTGYGQERGGITTKIFNNHWTSLDVVLLQNIPWYVPVYLHTLKITSGGKEIKPLIVKYIPGKQRERPYYVEILITVPPRSITSVSLDFNYIFLKWQEYPPDANHGFYIGSAIVSCNLPLARNFTGLPQDGSMISDSFNASRSGYLVQIRTETILITLPTPDFSMPYNVICLACTVVALAFGPLHNITTRRLVLKPKKNETLLARLKRYIDKLKGKLKRTRGSE